MSSEHILSFQLTDLGLKSRTFSLKINKFPTFLWSHIDLSITGGATIFFAHNLHT